MHPLRQFISQFTPVAEQDWQAISNCLLRRELKKETLLLEEGKTCKHLYFLEKGLLRFFVWKDGIDITKYFTDVPYVFTSQKSFNQQVPAQESIETLEDSIIWQMSYEHAQHLLELKPWSTFIRLLIQEVQTYTEEILEALQTQTAEQRYKMLLQQDADLLQRVPLKHLASYLGIAPQSLSRIRKKIQHQLRT
ncbi:MAG: Crp/Fnr family transcriptional regulator [Haliscomenobacter sp.]|uniref:Crp/Fnr family transcriptional regulator n=1 Tax=Haliscomenobacter sp. TaxID=2717303 RepID=UPI0029BC45F2|nr:Crp/Fnr family transcriptional regulator [Haliscomenobacter sp.]MDX2072465.1 Crp/Fnr family transcriptional regulator [Haliscomenobacter sp.]